MKHLNCIELVLAVASLIAATGKIVAAPVGTAFTYQGRLTEGTNVANGQYDLQCVLFDAASGGNPVGPTNLFAPVAVSNGQFTLPLDFGGLAFDGNARWLEIGVRTNSAVGGFTTLTPRQPLTPTPYALRALALWPGEGSVVTGLGATVGGGAGNTNYGNYATISGGMANTIKTNAVSATVGGGAANVSSEWYATVGGGAQNTSSGWGTTVGGGEANTSSGDDATVAGGSGNRSSGEKATVGGGIENTSSGDGATVAGGRGNVSSGDDATVGGGTLNTSSSSFAVVGGGTLNVR